MCVRLAPCDVAFRISLTHFVLKIKVRLVVVSYYRFSSLPGLLKPL